MKCIHLMHSFKLVFVKLILVSLIALMALDAAYAGNVTAGPANAAGSLVIDGRPPSYISCDIRADGVAVSVPDALKAFICQLKMLGATELGYMVVSGGQFVNYSLLTDQSGTGKIRSASVFSGLFFLEVLGTSVPGGSPMTSPDQAVIAAVAIARNRPVAVTYWGAVPLFYLSPGCSLQAGEFSGMTPLSVIASITLL